MNKTEEIKIKFNRIKQELNERSQRIWAATEAISIGHGGIRIVHKATGLAESTIQIGKNEVLNNETIEGNRIRRKGAGRKSLEETNKNIVQEIINLANADSIVNLESTLHSTTKSLRYISEGLRAKGYLISHTKVGSVLKNSGFKIQTPKKRNKN